MIFEWDAAKCKQNIEKHGVTFTQAVAAYFDPLAICLKDDTHGEERIKLIGSIDDFFFNLLLVIYIEKNENTVRFISARPATTKERKAYEKGNY